MTYTIEELKPGMSESFAKTVSERDVALFGEVSGDLNPAHFDEDFAKTTVFKGRIVHGALVLSYLSTVLGTKMPGPGAVFLSQTTRFKAPVRIGDTVTAVCTVRKVHLASRCVIFDCLCKVKDTVVVSGEATVMVPLREAA
ncbi:MAG TPA: MaoC family dehydratase [Rhizomicrobium sp.]